MLFRSINPTTQHSDIGLSCLRLVKTLKRNPCSLPPFTMNQDIYNLPQLLKNKLGGAMQYSCHYWARHLALSPTFGDFDPMVQAVVPVTSMLKSAPPWIEVMSLEGHLEGVIHSMYNLLAWLDKVSDILYPIQRSFANNCKR